MDDVAGVFRSMYKGDYGTGGVNRRPDDVPGNFNLMRPWAKNPGLFRAGSYANAERAKEVSRAVRPDLKDE